jgi:D-glycerate 3-kinase
MSGRDALRRVLQALAGWPRPAERPLLVGLCGAQGSGKSTLCEGLERSLAQTGEPCVIVGLDDYYLSRAVRAVLARDVHPLFATRGPPGTHDIPALAATLEALMAGQTPRLRRFDKASDDVAPQSAWPLAPAGASVVVLEGWCVGAQAQATEALTAPQNALEAQEDPEGIWRGFVNAALAGVYQSLFSRLDRLILLRPPSFDVVFGWRAQQEATTAKRADAAGLPAPALMNEAALARFIQHYERLTRAIMAEMPDRADLTLQLDAQRQVVG